MTADDYQRILNSLVATPACAVRNAGEGDYSEGRSMSDLDAELRQLGVDPADPKTWHFVPSTEDV